MKNIRQFRYYGVNNELNYPEITNFWGNLVAGNIFQDCGTISQLGIQARPGTKFYLNESINEIIVGETGIYELDLEGVGIISAIRFDKQSLADIQNNNDVLLIDIVYEGAF